MKLLIFVLLLSPLIISIKFQIKKLNKNIFKKSLLNLDELQDEEKDDEILVNLLYIFNLI